MDKTLEAGTLDLKARREQAWAAVDRANTALGEILYGELISADEFGRVSYGLIEAAENLIAIAYEAKGQRRQVKFR